MVPGMTPGGLLKKNGHFWNKIDLLRKHRVAELTLSESRRVSQVKVVKAVTNKISQQKYEIFERKGVR